MRNLVRRYVTQEQRKAESQGVTEDDVNEIKNIDTEKLDHLKSLSRL